MNENTNIKNGLADGRRLIWFGAFLFVFGLFATTVSFALYFVILIVAICCIFYGYKRVDDAKKEYANYYLVPLIKTVFPNAIFNIREHDEELVFKYKDICIFDDDTDRYITNYLKANDGTDFEMFTLKTSHEYTDSDGDTHVKDSFFGTVISYKLDTGMKDVVRVICSDLRKVLFVKHESTFVRKKCELTPVKIETGNIEFDDNFEVYAGQMHDAYYLLNPYVMEKLQNFRDKYGDFCMAFTEASINISFEEPDLIIKLPSVSSDVEFEENPFICAKEQIEDLKKYLNDIAFAISKHTENKSKF